MQPTNPRRSSAGAFAPGAISSWVSNILAGIPSLAAISIAMPGPKPRDISPRARCATRSAAPDEAAAQLAALDVFEPVVTNRLTFPFRRTVAIYAGPLSAYSGGTVRDSHPLPSAAVS